MVQLHPLVPVSMEEKAVNDIEFDKIKRTPILLNHHTVMLIQLFHARDSLRDSWTWDHYGDPREDNRVAAEQLIAQLENHCSPDFLMKLRDVITQTLRQHDTERGTQFATERGCNSAAE